MKLKNGNAETNNLIVVDSETGEVLDESKEVKRNKYLAKTKEEFYFTYLSAISLIDHLDKVAQKVLFYCNMYCQWETNMISLTKGILKDMEDKIGLKYQTIRNSIVKLKKLGVFIDLGGATYRINPKYYWKGSYDSRIKTMKWVLEIECPDCL